MALCRTRNLNCQLLPPGWEGDKVFSRCGYDGSADQFHCSHLLMASHCSTKGNKRCSRSPGPGPNYRPGHGDRPTHHPTNQTGGNYVCPLVTSRSPCLSFLTILFAVFTTNPCPDFLWKHETRYLVIPRHTALSAPVTPALPCYRRPHHQPRIKRQTVLYVEEWKELKLLSAMAGAKLFSPQSCIVCSHSFPIKIYRWS